MLDNSLSNLCFIHLFDFLSNGTPKCTLFMESAIFIIHLCFSKYNSNPRVACWVNTSPDETRLLAFFLYHFFTHFLLLFHELKAALTSKPSWCRTDMWGALNVRCMFSILPPSIGYGWMAPAWDELLCSAGSTGGNGKLNQGKSATVRST